jgi:glycosyltransferase involved in cell wall biosynthesis
MRIAYVINSVEGGGAAKPVPAIVSALKGNGADVRVFALTPRNRRGVQPMIDAGIDLVVREGGETNHFRAFRWLIENVAAYRATHVWTSLTRATLIGQLVGKRLGLPVVSWQHNAFLKPINERLLRASRNLTGLWIGDSACVTTLTAARLSVPPEKLACWPIFSADEHAPQAAPWQPGQTIKIGSLGRLHPAKGYDILIEALARLRAQNFAPPVSFEINVGGDGQEHVRLSTLLDKHAVRNVTLQGFIEDPAVFLAAQHIYVQPSRREGFCIAAHEAMQAGLPIIASGVGELSSSVDHHCGQIVKPCDPLQLADALAHFIARPEHLETRGRAAREKVLDRFSAFKFAANAKVIIDRINTDVRDQPELS